MKRFLLIIIMTAHNSFIASFAYQLVPIDFSNENMQKQLCEMIEDDQDIQAMTHDTSVSIRTMWEKKIEDLYGFVCKTTDGTDTICGYVFYRKCPIVYFFIKENGQVGTCSNQDIMYDLLQNNPEIYIQKIASIGYVASIAVHKNYRGKCIAQNLLVQVEQDCKNNGMELCMLSVLESNNKALKVYLKCGFAVQGKGEDGYITMQKLI